MRTQKLFLALVTLYLIMAAIQWRKTTVRPTELPKTIIERNFQTIDANDYREYAKWDSESQANDRIALICQP